MYEYRYPHPAVTADSVVFAIRDGALCVLLIERAADPYRGAWALPGGFVGIDEALDAAAARELEEETGLSGIRLEQLHTFGQPDRDPRERVITVAYVGLVSSDRARVRAASDARSVGWFPVDGLPPLAFDHRAIVETAWERLKAGLHDASIALQLMPEEFTLTELQSVHELILGAPVDKRNFRKRMLAAQVLEETGHERRDGAHRPARVYRAIDGGIMHGSS